MDRISLKKHIVKTIETSSHIDGYKCLNKLCYKDLFVFCKHLEDIYYSYIIFRLSQSNSINVSLWVGPIDRPDDGLYSLSANIELKIVANTLYNESLIENCHNRINNVIDSNILSNLITVSKRELTTPSFGLERNYVYNNFILPFFQLVIEKCKDKAVLRDKKKTAPIIIDIYNKLNQKQKSFFCKIGKDETVNIIWELCYIYSYNN